MEDHDVLCEYRRQYECGKCGHRFWTDACEEENLVEVKFDSDIKLKPKCPECGKVGE